MKIFTLLVLSLFICGVSTATTYYISPTGNDNTGNGTIGNPWKTLFKATSTVTTVGDIIHVNAGTYTETQQSNLSRGVSIQGDGLSTTIINSTQTGTWSTFLDLSSPNNTNGAQSISGLTLDGGYISESNVKTWVGIWITGRSNVLIHDCRLRNWKQSSTIFNGNTNTNPGTDIGQPSATGNKFYNNTVTNSSAMYNGTGQGALMIGFQTGMEIYGNDISQTQRPNFLNGWPIKYWNQGWLKGVKIYNNTLTKIPYSGSYPGENGNWDFCIEFFNIEGLEIYGNTIQGAIDMAYCYKGAYAHCAWIHDNTLSHPVQGTKVEGAVIFEYRAEAALVENNIINNKTYGVTFNTRGVAENGDDRYYLPGGPPVGGYSYVVDCIIRKNLFSNMYNGTGAGNRFAIGVISDGPNDPQINNMQIYNNTMVAQSGDPAYIGLDFTSQENGNCQGLYIRNNIATGFPMGWLRGSNGATNINNTLVTHNNAFGNGSGNTPVWPAGNPTAYTYNNNISLNPLFVSILSFLLQPLSPCINAGVNVGLPYNGSAPDMGYSEFGGASSGPTPPVVGTITQPTCAVATGSVALSGLPLLAWTLTRSPGGNTTTGVGTTTTITGLPSGTYTYTVTDVTGTSTPSANIVINAQPATPSAPTVGTITQPTCAVATGSTVLNGLPATGTWTLARSPGGTTTTGTGTTTTITGLAAGTYTYTVTNASGCISTASANIVVNAQPATPTAPTVGTITQPTVPVPTGSVVLNGLSATGTWTLTMNPGAVTTTGTGTTTTITGLAAGTYTFTVTGASGCTSVASANVVINGAASNIPPTANAGANQTITLPINTIIVSGSGTDPDGFIVAYLWTKVSGPAAGTITNPTMVATSMTGLVQGVYQFELRVTDNNGAFGRDTMQVTVNPGASNIPPTANAGSNQTITLPTNFVIVSGSATDPDGTVVAYLWTKVSGPASGTITNPTMIATSITSLVQGTYQFELRVTDNNGAFGRDTMQVTVNPGASNIPPTANAGTNQAITLPVNSIIVSGSGTDPDGIIVAYLWTKVSGPAAAGTITNPATAATSVTGLVQGVYQFELRVTDNNGAFGRDTMQVTVNAGASNIPPAANAGPDQTISLPTNSIIVSGSGTDPDGIIVAYLWTKVSGPAAGTITNTNTAATSVTGLAQGTYRFELRVTDNNGAFGRDTMQVIVNAGASNIPPTANAGANQTISLPANSVILSGSGTDTDGTIVAYLWTKVSGPAAGTITNPATAATSVTGLVQGVYQFELRVTDNNGAFGRDTMQVTVNAGASNIPPAANAGPDQTITLPTNSIIVSGSGTDPDGFIVAYLWTKVSGPAAGTITNPATIATSITGLAQGTYRFELRVTDNNGAFGRDTMQVIVNAGAPNIPPAANAGPDQTITLPANSVILSGSGTDTDGTIVAYLWTKVSGPANGTISSPNSAISTVTGLVQGTYRFELRVTDNNGAFGRDTMQVIVNPGATNTPPSANAGPDQTITLPVNSVILSGSGIDPDGTIVAYLWTKISGPAAGTITNANTAATSVTGLVQGTYRFELRVTDNNGAFGRDTMQVIVNPIAANIPPTADAGPDQTITLPVNSVILSGSGTDPDGTIVAYLWTKVSGPAAGTITNSATAATSVTGLAQGTYKFELRVTDNNGAFGRDTMQVIVNPIGTNIPPDADAGPDQTITLPANSVILSGSGTDQDGTIVDYLWTKISGPAAGTITNPNIAATAVTGLVQGTYRFELRVTDNNGDFGRDTMQVTVNPVGANTPPAADAGPDQTITLPTNSIIVSGNGTDPDGIIVAYLWTKISGPASGTITNPNMAATSITGLAQGVYQFELRVTDDGGAFGRDTMQVTVNDAPNIAPDANAGPDQSVVAPTTSTASSVNVTGSGTDPDGIIVAYLWTKVSGPTSGNITNPNSASSSATGLVVGTYEFELRVTDDDGAFGRDTMQVTISAPPNIPPAANAGPDRSLVLPANSTSLTGSGTDVDGTIVAWEWKQISGPSNNVLFSLNTAITYVNNLVEGTYEFELTVTDNRGAKARDNVLVIVTSPQVNTVYINDASLYPNPVVGIANLDIKSEKLNSVLSVMITDIQGKNVYRKDLKATQFNFTEKIDMSNLLKGVYIVTVYFDNGEKHTIKAIKQ